MGFILRQSGGRMQYFSEKMPSLRYFSNDASQPSSTGRGSFRRSEWRLQRQHAAFEQRAFNFSASHLPSP